MNDTASPEFIKEFKKIMKSRYGKEIGNQKIKEAKKHEFDFDFCTELIDE